MATAVTPSTTPTTPSRAIDHTVEAKRVAKVISATFQECLTSVAKDEIQKRSDGNSLNFDFSIHLHAKSHPCFGTLSNLDLHDKEGCIPFLLQVGKELTLLIKPSDFRYNIEVNVFEVVNEPVEKREFITASTLSISCFGEQFGKSTPEVTRSSGNTRVDARLYQVFQKNCERTRISGVNPNYLRYM